MAQRHVCHSDPDGRFPAFWGGTIAIFGLVFFRNNLRSHGVPYGVAISLAFIFVYPLPSLFY